MSDGMRHLSCAQAVNNHDLSAVYPAVYGEQGNR